MTVNTDGTRPTVLPTIRDLFAAVALMGGAVQGDDADGLTDIEWSAGRLADAVAFAKFARRAGWPVEIRPGSPILSLGSTVVLQVQAQPRDRSAFERDRYPANAVTPQPVDETLPRNCPTCQTIEWWCVPNATARRILWHGAGHPSDQGEAIVRDELRFGGEPKVQPAPERKPAPVTDAEFWGF
jgi:hypothetical protein